jgi:hypothetical protein
MSMIFNYIFLQWYFTYMEALPGEYEWVISV